MDKSLILIASAVSHYGIPAIQQMAAKKMSISAEGDTGPVAGVLSEIKQKYILPKDETPIHEDGRIPSAKITDLFPEAYKPVTVSEVLESILQFRDDPMLQVMEAFKNMGMNLQEFRSVTIRYLSDMEYLLRFIPEDQRQGVLEYWNTNYSKFPGFQDLRILEEWIKTRGDRMLLFLLGQAARYQREKDFKDGRQG